MRRRIRATRPSIIAALAALVLFGHALPGRADDERAPIAKYVTVDSPVNEKTAGRVRNAALTLQNRSQQEDRPAYLVLEIRSGTSTFIATGELAKFLVSPEIANVRTVAWVPESVSGHNALVALACREIVLHPDAELGDVGRGKPLDDFAANNVRDMLGGRHNRMLPPALVEGLIDPRIRVLRAEVTEGDKTTVDVVTEQDFEAFKKRTEGEIRSRVISEPGDPLLLTGRKWRDLDLLAVATVEDRTGLLKLYKLPFDALREEQRDDDRSKVTLVRVDDRIDPVMGAFIRRQITRALGRGVNRIVFEISSPGGRLADSADLANAIADLGDRKNPIHTVAYIADAASGGAAIVALGCDEIYMRPTATIGNIAETLVEEGEHANDENVATISKILGELADRKHRPRAIVQAMVIEDAEIYRVRHVDDGNISFMTKHEIDLAAGVWVEDGANPLVPETREPGTLNIDGQRAAELQIAAPPVADLDDLKLRLGIPANQRFAAAERTWVDDVVFLLNTEAALYILLVAGFVLMFLEAHMMTGIMAFGSILCFVLFFWSRNLGGTAGWLEVILFTSGLFCLVIETFVIPGFGVFGIFGGLMMFGSIVMASQTFGNIEPNEDFRRMASTIGTMGASIVSVMIIGAVASRYLPHLPLFRHMVLQPPGGDEDDAPQLKKELTEGFAGIHAGDTGVTSTTLRPAGKATIKGVFLDVVSDGPFIDPGQAIEVVAISGNRVVVRRTS